MHVFIACFVIHRSCTHPPKPAQPKSHHAKPTHAGVYCSLLTGQEKRIVPFAEHISATVEMVNLANVRARVFVSWLDWVGCLSSNP